MLEKTRDIKNYGYFEDLIPGLRIIKMISKYSEDPHETMELKFIIYQKDHPPSAIRFNTESLVEKFFNDVEEIKQVYLKLKEERS